MRAGISITLVALAMTGVDLDNATAQTPPCGTEISGVTVMDSDLDCTSSAVGLIASKGSELDCAGHSIIVGGDDLAIGVDVRADNVSVRNCDFRLAGGNFVSGVAVSDAQHFNLSNSRCRDISSIPTSAASGRCLVAFESSNVIIDEFIGRIEKQLGGFSRVLQFVRTNQVTLNAVRAIAMGPGSAAFLIGAGSNDIVAQNLSMEVGNPGEKSGTAFCVQMRGKPKNILIEDWSCLASEGGAGILIELGQDSVFRNGVIESAPSADSAPSINFYTRVLNPPILGNGGFEYHQGRTLMVESSFAGGGSAGEATTMCEIDLESGSAFNCKQGLHAGEPLGFGFDALVSTGGRLIANQGGGMFVGPETQREIEEIDPTSFEVSDTFSITPSNFDKDDFSISGLTHFRGPEVLAISRSGEIFHVGLTDLESATATKVALTGIKASDVARDPDTGTLHVVSRWRAEDDGFSHYYRIDPPPGSLDPPSGEVTDLSDLATEVSSLGVQFVSDISLIPDGNGGFELWGLTFGQVFRILPDGSTEFPPSGLGVDPFEPVSENNVLEDITFATEHGSVHYTGPVVLPIAENIGPSNLSIANNEIFVDSAALPILDQGARLRLDNLDPSACEVQVLVDENDDGDFAICPRSTEGDGPTCTNVELGDGTLSFTVSGFTTYSSNVDVPDTTPPSVIASLTTTDEGDEQFRANFSVTDACDPAPTVAASLIYPDCFDIAVTDGEVFAFEFEGEKCGVETEDGSHKIKAPDLTLSVVATDASGNVGSVEISPSGQ